MRLNLPNGTSPADMERIVLSHPEICSAIEGKTVQKVICVPGRLVNLIIR